MTFGEPGSTGGWSRQSAARDETTGLPGGLQLADWPARGPTGVLSYGHADLEFRNGTTFHQGKLLGVLDDDGNLSVRHPAAGPLHGNLWRLPGAVFKGNRIDGGSIGGGPTGLARVADIDLAIREGKIIDVRGRRLGTLDDAGHFVLHRKGILLQGRRQDVPGLAFAGTRGDGSRVSHVGPWRTLTLEGETLAVSMGGVFAGGKRVGSVDEQGRLQIVRGGRAVAGAVRTATGAVVLGHDCRGGGPEGQLHVRGSAPLRVRQGDILDASGRRLGLLDCRGDLVLVTGDGILRGHLAEFAWIAFAGSMGEAGRSACPAPSGVLRLGSESCRVAAGAILDPGSRYLGTLDSHGGFSIEIGDWHLCGSLAAFGLELLPARPARAA